MLDAPLMDKAALVAVSPLKLMVALSACTVNVPLDEASILLAEAPLVMFKIKVLLFVRVGVVLSVISILSKALSSVPTPSTI